MIVSKNTSRVQLFASLSPVKSCFRGHVLESRSNSCLRRGSDSIPDGCFPFRPVTLRPSPISKLAPPSKLECHRGRLICDSQAMLLGTARGFLSGP